MEKYFKSIYYVLSLILVLGLVNIVMNYKFINSPSYTGYRMVSVTKVDKDLECMALNIYREAGYEPFEGKVAVAQVTMNRVKNPLFPKEVCDVVYQKNLVYEKVVCQFSWYCDSAHRNKPINREAYADSYEVAKKVYLEGFRLPSLEDALYYHADYVSPNWHTKEKITKIGAHIFYRNKYNGKDV